MILIEKIHEIFDLWIDKTGSSYYTSDQKDLFIQRGVVQYVNQYLKNPSSHVLEETHVDTEDVHTLIHSVELVSDAKGLVTFDSINSELPTNKNWMYFMSVARGSNKDCGGEQFKSRWVRHNDYLAQITNTFKKPEINYPIHRYFSNYIKFDPGSQAAAEITVLVYPNIVTLDDLNDTYARGVGAVDLDLPDKVFNEIVYLALSQAGVNLREQEFYTATEREVSKNV